MRRRGWRRLLFLFCGRLLRLRTRDYHHALQRDSGDQTPAGVTLGSRAPGALPRHVFNRHCDLGQTSTIFFSEA